MNKKLFLIILICAITTGVKAQPSHIDTVAVSILDNMSAMIGDMGSCSITVNANYDVHNQELGLIKRANESQVYLQGPDKLLIRSEGEDTISYSCMLLPFCSFIFFASLLILCLLVKLNK